jgi:hypothetical protein
MGCFSPCFILSGANNMSKFDESELGARKRGEKVPVIRTNDYGGGYADRVDIDYETILRTDYKLAKAVLNQDKLAFHARLESINTFLKTRIKHSDVYYEFETLTIEWVAEDEFFTISEYDGCERLIRRKHLNHMASLYPLNDYVTQMELKKVGS